MLERYSDEMKFPALPQDGAYDNPPNSFEQRVLSLCSPSEGDSSLFIVRSSVFIKYLINN